MPEGRLQRTRDAYPPDRGPTLSELLNALPRLVHRCHVVTDPTTGLTSRVFEPQRFEVDAWNVIEGEEHDAPQPPLSPPPRGLDD